MTYLKESIFGTLDEKYDYQVDLRMPPDSNNEKFKNEVQNGNFRNLNRHK